MCLVDILWVGYLDHHDFLKVLSNAAKINASLEVRFACLAACAVSATELELDAQLDVVHRLCDRLRVPSCCRDLAILTVRVVSALESIDPMCPEALCDVIEKADAFRQPKRFAQLMKAAGCLCVASSRNARTQQALAALQLAQQAASSVDAKSVAKLASSSGQVGVAVGQAIRQARVESIAANARAQDSDAPQKGSRM